MAKKLILKFQDSGKVTIDPGDPLAPISREIVDNYGDKTKESIMKLVTVSGAIPKKLKWYDYLNPVTATVKEIKYRRARNKALDYQEAHPEEFMDTYDQYKFMQNAAMLQDMKTHNPEPNFKSMDDGITAISNIGLASPLLALKYGIGSVLGTGADLVGGALGGAAVDQAWKHITGANWATDWSRATGLPTWVTGLTNPGYYAFPITRNIVLPKIEEAVTPVFNLIKYGVLDRGNALMDVYRWKYGNKSKLQNSTSSIKRTLLDDDFIVDHLKFKDGTATNVYGYPSTGKAHVGESALGVSAGRVLNLASTYGLNLAGGSLDEDAASRVAGLKSFMRNSRPGSSFSGDANSPTLGGQLITDLESGNYGKMFKHWFTNTADNFDVSRRMFSGMSPDAESMFYRLGQEPGMTIRYATTPSGNFNGLANPDGRNYWIYTALLRFLKGEITQKEYLDLLNAWLKPLGGRPAFIQNGQIYRWQPYAVSKKKGGKL